MKITAKQLAEYLKGELKGDTAAEVDGVSPVTHARQGTVTFAEDASHLRQALDSSATVLITYADAARALDDGEFLQRRALICVKNPRVAFAQTLHLFYPPPHYTAGIHPTAHLGINVELGEEVHIGPYAVIGNNVRIGARTVIESAVTVGEGTVIGEDCMLYPRVVLYPRVTLRNRVVVHSGTVIGSDGFGYVPDGGKHLKIPQIGNVIIEDDVEIGANTTIDRATLGSTIIKQGTKIDNLVQIAHNNTIGEHCLIAAQTGLAGSVTLGKYAMLGGQVGVGDHITIGDQAMIGAQGGVISDIDPKSVVWGTPAQPHRAWLRQLAALKRLPEIIKVLQQKGILSASHETRKG